MSYQCPKGREVLKPINQQWPNGMRVLTLPQDRFTTAHITVAFSLPLNDATVAANAMVPFLLRRRSAAYPDMSGLNKRLYELYGAQIDGDVLGVGDAQLLVMTAEVIRDRCALDGETPVADTVAVLRELLFRPYLVDGLFDQDDMQSEQRCMIERIRAEINEKRRYARRRCEELLCQGQACAVPLYGTEEQVQALDAETVTNAWQTMLATAPMQVIVQGVDDATGLVQSLADELAAIARTPIEPGANRPVAARELVEETEQMELNQCKLVLGFYSEVAPDDACVPAMRLMNALLGGTAHSLLFRHVREEQSLCYYCASSYDRHKGILMIDSGVEAAMVTKAKEEILRQLTAIQTGDFSDEELDDAKRSTATRFYMNEDGQDYLSGWYLGQTATCGAIQTPTEAADELAPLTKAEVQAAAKRFTLGCVYLLQPTEKEATACV